ncbi:VanZ family protein [Streptomyces lonarensis]|uniref:VanZ family protein n=2 Tax=Streptomyces lonarensis TaxID=700599 RepID=A0A7X6D2D3_9ACTN|nr:VanZ family protein [Streptomyces lonarensis]NJQ06936.1 VanZ family protein [Streptomyces lonarensis]
MDRRVRLAALLLSALLVGVVAWLTLRPAAVPWVSPGNLQPLATLRAELDGDPRNAAATIGGGLLRLAPLGVLLPLLGRELGGTRLVSLARAVFATGVIALLLEVVRSAVPSRVSDVDQVLLAAAGAGVLHLITYGWLRTRLLPGRHPGNDRDGPGTAGRAGGGGSRGSGAAAARAGTIPRRPGGLPAAPEGTALRGSGVRMGPGSDAAGGPLSLR